MVTSTSDIFQWIKHSVTHWQGAISNLPHITPAFCSITPIENINFSLLRLCCFESVQLIIDNERIRWCCWKSAISSSRRNVSNISPLSSSGEIRCCAVDSHAWTILWWKHYQNNPHAKDIKGHEQIGLLRKFVRTTKNASERNWCSEKIRFNYQNTPERNWCSEKIRSRYQNA